MESLGILTNMKMHRFFVEHTIGDEREITVVDEKLLHQWRDVLRLEPGDPVILFDGSGSDFLCELALVSRSEAKLRLVRKVEREKENLNVYLCMSLIKNDNFELVLEKGTELGVTHFVPILAERSVKRALNMDRARTIIKEASEQSGRAVLPELHEVTTLDQVVEKFPIHFFACHPESDKFKYALPLFSKDEPIGILIGPEGGFTSNEIEFFKQKGIPLLGLGTNTLRAETAAIAVLSLVVLNQ